MRARARRAPRPRLPLFTGEVLSLDDLRAARDREMSERAIQRTLVKELRNPALTFGPVLVFHVPNGIPLPGLAPELKAKIWAAFEADGALPGAADLVIGHKGRVLFLELKRATGGRLTDDQKAFGRACVAAGLIYARAAGLSAARAFLQVEGVLR